MVTFQQLKTYTVKRFSASSQVLRSPPLLAPFHRTRFKPVTLGEAVLEATALQVNEQVCNKDLRATWEGMQMRGQSSNAPGDFTSFAAQYVAAKVAEGIEHNIWAGNYQLDGRISNVHKLSTVLLKKS
jgi:hypothetical protein